MIKKIILLTLISFMFACQQEQDNFHIDATIDSNYNNKKVTIYRMEKRNKIVLDSAIVKDGKFTFDGKVDLIDAYALRVDSIRGMLPVIMENANMTIEIYADSIYASKITGSKENDITNIYKDKTKAYSRLNKKLIMRSKDSLTHRNEIIGIRASYDSLMQVVKGFNKEFIADYNDSAFSVFTLERMVYNKQISKEVALKLYEKLSDKMKNLRSAKETLKYINEKM
ncbi:DUF4369 domain-containing protein [uncultured Lacinutrix sp.]|uniref:DUF4369 domain-containing protein n=1 Tax=uncultured Lacinutrix sp. TaxID=574032 RepID=UPI00262FCEDA|nr:DUF4369 domain-containing protein [uncultured Lacinutrix sp.]